MNHSERLDKTVGPKNFIGQALVGFIQFSGNLGINYKCLGYNRGLSNKKDSCCKWKFKVGVVIKDLELYPPYIK